MTYNNQLSSRKFPKQFQSKIMTCLKQGSSGCYFENPYFVLSSHQVQTIHE